MNADGAQHQLSHRQILIAFSGLLLGMLLGALDQTVVATALPTIVRDLGGLSQLSWVVTASLLASTASIPLWGKLGDLYGRKRLFQLALAVFLTGSALCGIAASIGQLIGFRALQGLGAGGLFTLAMATVGELVVPRERGRYQGYIQAMFALASVAGPLIGGSIVDHFSWRWLFYVNLPVGAVALAVIGLTLHLPVQRQERAIDYLGAGLLAAGVTCLLLLLVWGGSLYAWTSPELVGLLMATLVLGAAFVLREQRAAEPVLPLALLRNTVLSICSATLFFSTCAFFAAVVFLPLFFQVVRGETATSSGVLLLPMMLGATLSAASSGRVISWTGRYKWFPVVGLALMAITLVFFSQMGTATAPLTTGVVMALFGLGFGMVGEVLILAVQNAVDRRELGTATGAANLFRALGGSVGVSLYGSIFTGQLREPVRDGVAQATAHALAPVFMTAALMAAIGFLLVAFLEERPLQQQADIDRTHQNGRPTEAPSAQSISHRRSTHVHA
ncbi:MAG TPA: MDR family MFS transporter [Chloroflexota bacterium]|nr:MDR family MFS transporter [Chloroflexota bacterium]